MNINEAIRAGCCILTRQVDGDFDDGQGGGCVLGAAFLGALGTTQGTFAASFMARAGAALPDLKLRVSCPQCGIARPSWCSDSNPYLEAGWFAAPILVHLNNDHQWTREAIAEWLDPHPELHVSTAELERERDDSAVLAAA